MVTEREQIIRHQVSELRSPGDNRPYNFVTFMSDGSVYARSFTQKERSGIRGNARRINRMFSADSLRKAFLIELNDVQELNDQTASNPEHDSWLNGSVAWRNAAMTKVAEFCTLNGYDQESQVYDHLRAACDATYQNLTEERRLEGDYSLSDEDFRIKVTELKLPSGEVVPVWAKCGARMYGEPWFKAAVQLITEASPAAGN